MTTIDENKEKMRQLDHAEMMAEMIDEGDQWPPHFLTMNKTHTHIHTHIHTHAPQSLQGPWSG